MRRVPPARWRRRRSSFGNSLRGKHAEVDRFRHSLVAGIVRMQVVSLVEVSPDLVRIGGILHDLVKIDYAIESPAGADPLVDGHALRFLLIIVVALEGSAPKGIVEGRERRTKY